MENHNNHGMETTSYEKNHSNGHPTTPEVIEHLSSPIPVFNTMDFFVRNSIKSHVNSDVSVLSQAFKDCYQQQIEAIENDKNLDENEKNKEKLTVLLKHNKELQDQNDTFVSTLLELEREAQLRVQQMERRLKSSAKTTMEAVININDCAKEMQKIVEERVYVESLYNDMQQHVSNIKDENSFLRDQNYNLHHDIQALLQIIQHARCTGHWEMNCVTFCEVTPEQVFGPVQSISNLCTADSPQLEHHLDTERKVSNASLQDVINSSTFSPCTTCCDEHQLMNKHSSVCVRGCDNQKGDNKDKRIALLESQVSELEHRLNLKTSECECHIWKLEMLIKQNQNKMQLPPFDLQHSGTSLPKCISLPEIGNIYSFARVNRKSFSCGILNNAQTSCMKTPKLPNVKYVNSKYEDASEFNKGDSDTKKSDKVLHTNYYNDRGQSEPHLFMYGDSIYVYKPCEPIKKISHVALHDDYETSVPPCQSIDLKFPTENSNKKLSDWTTLSKSSYHSIPQDLHYKGGFSCSYTSSYAEIESDNKIIHSDANLEKYTCFQSTSSQTEEIAQNSVSLQAAIRREEEKYCMCSCSDPGVHSFDEKIVEGLLGKDLSTTNHFVSLTDSALAGMEDETKEKGYKRDLHQMINIMQTMKESLVKAEDKAAAKEILLEQLQGHLTSAVKEVELKDIALNNVEKKLDISRNESSDLRNEISRLQKDVDNLQMLNDNILLKVNVNEEKINDMSLEQKTLQDQKRSLLTRLDAQGDELHKAKQELLVMQRNAESYALQVEQQTQIIRNLQEALVQSKRAFDASHKKTSLWEVSPPKFESESKSSSKSSIVDI
ncbi:hypothetical protein JTE90_023807 [Oedothorax gibbosus]|uniref:Uncharacterized protein n=1 Tax=Oedothorax gibbosus TaxID=931172 RepID=A0AAV6VJD7_9ARAC|nr:hypothetical protein JTE90_023807 [Oedothorax gibbosus]